MATQLNDTKSQLQTQARGVNNSQEIAASKTVLLGVSWLWRNKKSLGPTAHTEFITTEATLKSLFEHIKVGGAFSVAALHDNYRDTAHFQHSQIIGVDLDSKSIQEAILSPLIRDHAFLIYATSSDSPENPRSRALFLLDRPCTDASEYRALVLLVLANVGIEADERCKDAARVFYGSTKAAEKSVFRPEKVLSIDTILGFDKLPKTPDFSPKTRQEAAVKQLVERKPASPLSELQRRAYLGNCRRIADALGVMSYNSNGYSNKVHCPCGQHRNGDEHPSASWFFDEQNPNNSYLCCKVSGNYGVKKTAAMLGIELEQIFSVKPGLFNITRETLLKAKKGSFARFWDAFRMMNNEGGWYTLPELRAALKGSGLEGESMENPKGGISARTLRYTIAEESLFSSDDWGAYAHEGETNRLPLTPLRLMGQAHEVQVFSSFFARLVFFCSIFHITKREYYYSIWKVLQLNQSLNIDWRKMLPKVVPPRKPPTPQAQEKGKGRPKLETYFYVPTEQEAATAWGYSLAGAKDHLTFSDLVSERVYCQTLNTLFIKRNPGQHANASLGSRLGKTARTAHTYVSKEKRIIKTPMQRLLGQLEAMRLDELPMSDDSSPNAKKLKKSRFLTLTPDGKGTPTGYTRERAIELMKRGLTVYVHQREANHYEFNEDEQCLAA